MSTLFIHTSDRILFKRCRRAWNWRSPLRQNLDSKEKRLPLWFGTGWHFVLEDLWGPKLYHNSHDCWDDFVKTTLHYYGEDFMPRDWEEGRDLGHKMIDHYVNHWLPARQPLQTFIWNGIPQVEVNFRIPIPMRQEVLDRAGVDCIYYQGTIDRVAIDEYGNLWQCEYKSAKIIEKYHFLTDPQVTAYTWAAKTLYGQDFAGCLYQQWKKDVPEEPRVLRNGTVSVAENQKTNYRCYRDALTKIYGDASKAPTGNIDYLNRLAMEESPDDDGFIREDKIARNQFQLEAEGAKILMEAEDMLNPDLPLYPNPTRDCAHMCDFKDACVSFDDGSDFESILEADFEHKSSQRGRDPWRQYLTHPTKLQEMLLLPNQQSPQLQPLQ